MLEVINNQRKIKINKFFFQTFAEAALKKIGETEGKDFTVAFVSDRKMRELNNNFRGKNLTTDVLSFTFEADKFETENDNLGDIAISLEQAERQAQDNKSDLETEIKQLILHGILHLCGYDHETDNGEMNKRELELREVLEIN
jgi:probable rRNA maturation factor